MPNPNGNRSRCRATDCHSLASKDGWCKNHRPKPNQDLMGESYPLQRDNYKGFGGYFGRDSFFTEDSFSVANDRYGIEREDYGS